MTIFLLYQNVPVSQGIIAEVQAVGGVIPKGIGLPQALFYVIIEVKIRMIRGQTTFDSRLVSNGALSES